jgi:hypothetical protein
MKPGGGKQKGGAFERRICRELSLWMSNGLHEDLYWRSAMSGGRSTVAAGKGKRLAAQAGDISCVNEAGHALTDKFLIECKTYRDLQFEGLIRGKGHLADFWSETIRAAERYNKYPMLIAKQNQQPAIICLNNEGRSYFCGGFQLYVPDMDLYGMLFSTWLEQARRLP